MNHFKYIFLSREADEQNLSLSEKARLHLEKYSFPVEMLLALPNGTVVSWTGHLCDSWGRWCYFQQSWHRNLLIFAVVTFQILFTILIGFCLFKVHHINANVFLDQTAMKPEEEEATFSFSAGFEDPSTSTYISFLKEGLEKAKQYQAQ